MRHAADICAARSELGGGYRCLSLLRSPPTSSSLSLAPSPALPNDGINYPAPCTEQKQAEADVGAALRERWSPHLSLKPTSRLLWWLKPFVLNRDQQRHVHTRTLH
jgi:hypothetical protein